RRRFRLREREISSSDVFVIVDAASMAQPKTDHRRLVIVVDSVFGVIEYPPESFATSDSLVPGLEYIEGIVKHADGLILIHDIRRCLSLDEERLLVRAMEERSNE
ncbi:MAG TPA: chemotaxis protein CheW, partial [Spirochaetia bacterium]|nr:chemotaxis protein CheW [Spirochaetia bacterium]